MAAMVVLAELKFRDGKTEQIKVQTEKKLSSLISGIQQLNADVSRLLTELVEQEKGNGVCAVGDEEDDSEEDDDPQDDPSDSALQPPLKKSKTRDTPEDR